MYQRHHLSRCCLRDQGVLLALEKRGRYSSTEVDNRNAPGGGAEELHNCWCWCCASRTEYDAPVLLL